ncbi:MAG: hypothetical protein JWM27_3724 [Gemmatimonadetes bacterium]|nr:hypothetical protein [Gemmatimonadota bacterium]
MKKLSLDLDALRVESFATAPAAHSRGTVQGNAYPTQSCPGASCLPTCGIVLSPGTVAHDDYSVGGPCCV